MTSYDRSALRQLKAGVEEHIAEQPTTITPMRRPLVSDGFGGTVRSGTPVAQEPFRGRLQHESGSVQKDSVGPTGLDTNLTTYILTNYRAPLEEEDDFDVDGTTWRVGVVNVFSRHGGVYKTEATLIRGTSVGVTIPENFSAEAVSDDEIVLTWEALGTVNTYSIERKTGSEAFAVIGTASGATRSFSDIGLEPETEYTYRMRAYSGTKPSAYTMEVVATTEAL